MKRLISMTDYALEQKSKFHTERFENIFNYANFLKQPLTLSMFVPTDENGNVLEEPIETIGGVELYNQRYQQAKSKVIFEGFEISYRDSETIILSNINNDIIEFSTNGNVYLFDEFSANIINDLIFYAEKENIELTLTDNVKI